MKLKLMLLSIFVFALVGCDKDHMTAQQRLDGVNMAGAEHGLTFTLLKKFPEMPDGAVLVFDADDRKFTKTEVYFDNLDPLVNPKNNRNNYLEYYFICEESKIIVSLLKYYYVEENESLSFALSSLYNNSRPLYSGLSNQDLKDIVLYVKKMTHWTEQSESIYTDYFATKGRRGSSRDDYGLGRFLFYEVNDPVSPLYDIGIETPPEKVEALFLAYLLKDQQLKTGDPAMPLVPIRNTVDIDALSDNTWKIYSIYFPYPLWGPSEELTENRKKDIKEKLLFLMD